MKNLIIMVTISVFLISCSSSRIFLNADVPKGQDIDINISTKKSNEE
jgi:hypothetical protein